MSDQPAANFKSFFIDQVSSLVTRSNNKYSCIEDQFYLADKFPRYEQDDNVVFQCHACKCLVQVECLTECDACERNFCDFRHTLNSVCDRPDHGCAKANLIQMRYGYHSTVCKDCIAQRTNRNLLGGQW